MICLRSGLWRRVSAWCHRSGILDRSRLRRRSYGRCRPGSVSRSVCLICWSGADVSWSLLLRHNWWNRKAVVVVAGICVSPDRSWKKPTCRNCDPSIRVHIGSTYRNWLRWRNRKSHRLCHAGWRYPAWYRRRRKRGVPSRFRIFRCCSAWCCRQNQIHRAWNAGRCPVRIRCLYPVRTFSGYNVQTACNSVRSSGGFPNRRLTGSATGPSLFRKYGGR